MLAQQVFLSTEYLPNLITVFLKLCFNFFTYKVEKVEIHIHDSTERKKKRIDANCYIMFTITIIF